MHWSIKCLWLQATTIAPLSGIFSLPISFGEYQNLKTGFKIVDKIIDEQNGFELTAKNMREEIIKDIKELNQISKTDLVEQRYSKFRQIGTYKERN